MASGEVNRGGNGGKVVGVEEGVEGIVSGILAVSLLALSF